VRPPCGTHAGVAAHRRHKEQACLACSDARADYIRANRITNRTSRSVHVPFPVARLLLESVPPEVLDTARRELGPRTVAALLARDAAVAS
jgi:hypothetical protein